MVRGAPGGIRWRDGEPVRARRGARRVEPPGATPRDWTPYLGRKVSVRFRLRDDPEHPFSEAIGVVQAVDASDEGARVAIRKRNGDLVSVAARDILAAKFFPL